MDVLLIIACAATTPAAVAVREAAMLRCLKKTRIKKLAHALSLARGVRALGRIACIWPAAPSLTNRDM